jgi:prepilin peptidase CpaA
VRIRALAAVAPKGKGYEAEQSSGSRFPNLRNESVAQPSAEPQWGALSARVGADLKAVILALAVLLAAIAGWTDYRSRRIPNWLTVPGLFVGIAANTLVGGWQGLKTSLLGAGLALLLLLPLVILRSLGAGDWKLAGALGAFVGPGVMFNLLLASIFVAGAMAVVLIIYKGRVRETLRNLGHMLAAFANLRLPGPEVSLDNPESLKVPYGVALAFTVVLYGIARARGAI